MLHYTTGPKYPSYSNTTEVESCGGFQSANEVQSRALAAHAGGEGSGSGNSSGSGDSWLNGRRFEHYDLFATPELQGASLTVANGVVETGCTIGMVRLVVVCDQSAWEEPYP